MISNLFSIVEIANNEMIHLFKKIWSPIYMDVIIIGEVINLLVIFEEILL
jgi:hypothetical protein